MIVLTKYKIDSITGCWLYTGYLQPDGYARRYNIDKKKMENVHQTEYEKKYGPVPEGMELDHIKEKCKYRHCVNPDHVEPVSHLENVLRGKNTKITTEQEEEIRKVFELDPRKAISVVAAEYNISRYTIWRLLRKKSPRHGSINIKGVRKLRSYKIQQ